MNTPRTYSKGGDPISTNIRRGTIFHVKLDVKEGEKVHYEWMASYSDVKFGVEFLSSGESGPKEMILKCETVEDSGVKMVEVREER
jgi:hypothetical protein